MLQARPQRGHFRRPLLDTRAPVLAVGVADFAPERVGREQTDQIAFGDKCGQRSQVHRAAGGEQLRGQAVEGLRRPGRTALAMHVRADPMLLDLKQQAERHMRQRPRAQQEAPELLWRINEPAIHLKPDRLFLPAGAFRTAPFGLRGVEFFLQLVQLALLLRPLLLKLLPFRVVLLRRDRLILIALFLQRLAPFFEGAFEALEIFRLFAPDLTYVGVRRQAQKIKQAAALTAQRHEIVSRYGAIVLGAHVDLPRKINQRLEDDEAAGRWFTRGFERLSDARLKQTVGWFGLPFRSLC